jgi:hypothetical protein
MCRQLFVFVFNHCHHNYLTSDRNQSPAMILGNPLAFRHDVSFSQHQQVCCYSFPCCILCVLDLRLSQSHVARVRALVPTNKIELYFLGAAASTGAFFSSIAGWVMCVRQWEAMAMWNDLCSSPEQRVFLGTLDWTYY